MSVKPYDGELTTGADEDGHVVYTDDLGGFAECISERATGADAADAAELARRWNSFPALLAACRDVLAVLDCLTTEETAAVTPIVLGKRVRDALRRPVADAEGTGT